MSSGAENTKAEVAKCGSNYVGLVTLNEVKKQRKNDFEEENKIDPAVYLRAVYCSIEWSRIQAVQDGS